MEHLRELITGLQLSGVPLKQGELLLRHTSFRIGGPASVMAFPGSEEQLREVFRLCAECAVRPIVLGAGTNVLAPDEGLDTLIVTTRQNMNEIVLLEDGVLEAQGGAMLSAVAVFAMRQGLSGLEFAHGIPGTVGGGVFMNAGAYGGEMKQVLTGVTVMYPDGRTADLDAGELDLGYRHSRFMSERAVITRARLRLSPGDPAEISRTMGELSRRRQASQPLAFPSAGSTFKRPQNGYAAALIDQAGLKGLTVGGAQVSEKHAGFIINNGGATCADVLELIRQVQAAVLAHSGVSLEPEVRILEVNR